MPESRITVIVPCFNDGGTLRKTVESVFTQEPCDLVVIDDGSTDPQTRDVLDDLRRRGVNIIHQTNQGQGAARSAGLRAATTRYVFPLDADDCLLPGSLAILADYLDEHPDVAIVWGRYETFGERIHVREVPRELDPWTITYAMDVPQSALIRGSALRQVGGWQKVARYEDWDLLIALAEAGFVGHGLPDVIYRYRLHGPRGAALSHSRHEENYARLRDKHPSIWAARRENRRRSTKPRLLKIAIPAIDAVPFLKGTAKLQLWGAAAHLAYRRGGYWRITKLLAAAAWRRVAAGVQRVVRPLGRPEESAS